MAELHFKGKEFVYNHHLSIPYCPLVSNEKKSVGEANLSDNLIIHGDNLIALKALLPYYAGKVDCVFIDPPYNTGSESWCYNDAVNSPIMREWLASNPVNKDDMLRHEKWLCMMYPRLKLLRELLSDRGAIFITIDDNEVHRLRSLLDEIFGIENFLACFAWQSKDTPGNNARGIAETHNYVLLYRKSPAFVGSLLERNEEQIANYTNPDNDKRGPWLAAPLTRGEHRDRDYYPLKNKVGRKVFPPSGSSWRRPPAKMKWLQEDDRIWWGKNGDAEFPMEKKFLSEAKSGVVNQTWWPYEFAGSTRNAGAEIKAIFNGEKQFPTAKPLALLHRIIELATDESSIILDSFAGSGTTAHAVLLANAKDNGDRKFILVESEDYADKLTAERVRRAIKGYEFHGVESTELYRTNITVSTLKNADAVFSHIASIENLEGHRFDQIRKEISGGALVVWGEKRVKKKTEGLGGSFTYCTLGDALDMDKLLTGKGLPSFKSLGAWLFHTATGQALKASAINESNWFLGETGSLYVWLIYKPDLDFLKSRAAALTLEVAEKIIKIKGEGGSSKRHLVFASAKYVPNKLLLPLGVEHSPLPFALYRIEKS